MRVRPLEDLLNDNTPPTLNSYRALKRALAHYVRPLDASYLAYHIHIPQKILKEPVDKKHSIFPQADTLICNHCHLSLTIPMKYPRFHENTQKAQRSVHYKPSAPQTCSCGNLNTLTDRNGNLRVYLMDNDETAFSFMHGPINLLTASQDADKPHDISLLLDAKRPQNDNQLSFEVRNQLSVNHVSLYRATQDVIRTLLPTDDLKGYARAYNILVFAGNMIYFPTGHAIRTIKFPIWALKVTDIVKNSNLAPSLTVERLFKSPVLTQESARVKNKIANYIYQELFPTYLEQIHEERSDNLAEKLNIPRSYAPRKPHDAFTLHTRAPLSNHRELLILRLPYAIDSELTFKYSKQDYHLMPSSMQHQNTRQYKVYETTLELFKRERLKSLNIMLPRYAKYAHIPHHHLNHTNIPPYTPFSLFSQH